MSDEALVALGEILKRMAAEDPRYNKNWWVFRAFSKERKERWYLHLEALAPKGNPMAQKIVNEMVKWRIRQ